MRRREFIAGLSCMAACPLAAWAQPALRRIGVLLPGSPESPFGQYPLFFKEGLAELGYIEGRDFILELRWAHAHNDRLPALAADLVERKVDLILATSAIAAQAAAEATTAIPIVQGSGGSPVRSGMAASLSRPQGMAQVHLAQRLARASAR